MPKPLCAGDLAAIACCNIHQQHSRGGANIDDFFHIRIETNPRTQRVEELGRYLNVYWRRKQKIRELVFVGDCGDLKPLRFALNPIGDSLSAKSKVRDL